MNGGIFQIFRRGRFKLNSLTFNIMRLFYGGEQGAWYDPSDIGTLFQDSAGTLPVTAVEQPVGRMLDKSGRGNHATQATTTKRPVLSRRVNLLLATATLATQSITTLAASHLLTFSGAGSITLSGTASGVFGAGTHTIACTAGTLTLTVAGAVNDADFRLATDAHLPYQRVNTAADYDADPAKFPAYLRFDGVDDALQTGNINFTGTDKMTVWAGVNESSTAQAMIVELTEFGLNTGAFSLYALSSSSFAFSSIGPSPNLAITAVTPELTNYVLTGYSDVTGGIVGVRLNGAPKTVALTGSGSHANAPLYIGSRGSTSNYLNGRLYSLIVRGAQSSLSQIEATEAYIKQKGGFA